MFLGKTQPDLRPSGWRRHTLPRAAATRPAEGADSIRTYTFIAVSIACLALVSLFVVEHRLEIKLIDKHRNAQQMVMGLGQLQEIVHQEQRINASVRRLAQAHGSANDPEAMTRIDNHRASLRGTTLDFQTHCETFRSICNQLASARSRSEVLRQQVFAFLDEHHKPQEHASHHHAMPEPLTVMFAELDTLELEMEGHASQVSAEVGLLVTQVEAEADRVRAWMWQLSVALVGLTVLGGLALHLALGRIYRDLNERQAETHRQNLELETVHMQELELRKTLDRERAMLELVLATVPQGVFWKDRDSVILGCNHAHAEMMGLGHPDQLVGTGGPDDNESFTEAQLEGFRRDDLQVMETGSPMLDYEERIERTDGSVIAVLTNKVPLRDHDGDIIGVLGVCIDITQRKQLEQQLAHVHKMESIGQLASGVAHEINTPTQFVSENMRFLRDAIEKFQRLIDQQERFADPDAPPVDWAERYGQLQQLKQEVDYDFIHAEAPKAVAESLDGLERIRGIISAMREFSHPGDAAPRPFDLNHVIESSATVCRNRWKYIAEIEYDLDPDLPEAQGHAGEFGQVLINLIVNAADALEISHPREPGRPATGRIRLATRLTPRWIEVEVRDNGTGIPEAIRDRIFDPFFTTKDVGQGTGQGLSITHHVVVVKHGGEVQVTNHPDGGAVFTLRLPIQAAQLDAAEAA